MVSLGFSWADEVEREEQEETERTKRKHSREEEELKQQPKRRADPFGAARPREVVLEEKGVDWRKIDQDLDAHSSRRCLATTCKKEHPRQKPPKQQNIEDFVPPLRYPPKKIASSLERIPKAQHDTRNSAADNVRFGHDLTINSPHTLIGVPQRSGKMELGMNSNAGTLNPRRGKGLNCKRKHAAATFTDEMENDQAVKSTKSHIDASYCYSDHLKEVTRLGKYNSNVAEEKVHAKRAILSDLNMERTKLRKNKRSGDAQAMRSSASMCQSVEPKMWLHQNCCRRWSASKGTEPRIEGNSTSSMSPCKDDDGKNKVMPTKTKSNNRRRRCKNQTSK